MKLLVILEMHFIRHNGQVYTEVTADTNFWNRYLEIFEEVLVCARMYDATPDFNPNNYLLSSRDRVEFIGLPDFYGSAGLVKNSLKTRKIVSKAVKMADRIIFRAPSPISLVAYPVIKKSRKPFAAELMMNPRTAYSKKALNNKLQPFIQFAITKQTEDICWNANGVSYVTEKVLQDLYPSRSIVLGETQEFFNASYSTITLKENDFATNKSLNTNPITLVHSGKMEDYRKGQIIFLKIIKNLVNLGINVKGVLIGDGSKRIEFENLAKDLNIHTNIKFTGWLSGYSKVQEELSMGDIFVFPTIGEGLPRSVIEAMANGLVCVSSPVDGVTELIQNELLADFDDIDKFVEIITNLIDNKEQMEEISSQNIKLSKKYHIDNLSKNRAEFYRKLKEVPNN
ncbi:glycosyltransferase [Aerococcus urinaeequi]